MAEPENLSPSRFRTSLMRMLFFASLTVSLFLAGIYLPVLGVWGLLISPLPLALLGMREGPRWQTVGTVVVLGGLLLGLDPLSALYFLIGMTPLSYALSFSPRLRGTGAEALLLCTGVSILSKLVLLGVFLALTGHNPLIPEPEQMRLLLMRLYAELPLEGEQAGMLREAVESMVAVFPYLLPSLLLLSSVLDAFLNYRLGVFFQRKHGHLPPLLPPFSEWRFSRTLLPAMFLAFFMDFFVSEWTAGAMFSMNLKLVLNVFFAFQGFSLLWWWLEQRRVGFLGRCLVFVFLLFPLLWLWFVFLGVGDMIFDLRRRGRRTKE